MADASAVFLLGTVRTKRFVRAVSVDLSLRPFSVSAPGPPPQQQQQQQPQLQQLPQMHAIFHM